MRIDLGGQRTFVLLACGPAPAVFAAVLPTDDAVRPGYDLARHFGSALSG